MGAARGAARRPQGLDAYRALLSGPVPAPAVALELGEGQADAMVALLEAAGFRTVRRLADLAGIERVVLGER